MTTGIDVPEITNLVFLRCTKSRILFDQMIGRATRLCKELFGDGQDKEYFHIYDAVGIYAKLQRHTDMKPVVANPKTTFAKLLSYLNQEQDEDILQDIRNQLVAKLRRKTATIERKWHDQFVQMAGGDPESIANYWEQASIPDLREWFASRTIMANELDKIRPGSDMLVSEHPDSESGVDRGFGSGTRPEDYLESFRKFLQDNMDRIPALVLVTQRPRDLTRKDLQELQLQLSQNNFGEINVKTAFRKTTNQDIAASVIGFVRHTLLNEPLVPYADRVDRAIATILVSQPWNPKQRQWLERIGKQLKENVVVDHDLFNSGAFRDAGGFARLNRAFAGRLEEIVRQIVDNIWQNAS